jgi:DNA topoisomerase-1
VNAYLREVTGEGFTAKDVRTWAGTVLAACALWERAAAASQTEANKHIVQAIDAVAKRLGNTRAVCRKCYVHPTVLEAYLDQSLFTMPAPDAAAHTSSMLPGLHPEEAAVLALLKARGDRQDAPAAKAS